MTDDPASQPQQQPVNRGRRARFVFVLVGACVLIPTATTWGYGLGVLTAQSAMAEALNTGLLWLGAAATLNYLTGSVVDYGGLRGMFGR